MQYKETSKDEALRDVIKSIMLYEQVLRDKKLLFITKSKENRIEIIEVMFKKENFFHLTGLKTDILVRTTRNSCLGLKFIEKNQIYVPNAVLKEDIRKITTKRNKIIAILKKDLRQNKYEKITYIAKNANIEILCPNKEISLKNRYRGDYKG